MKKTVIQEFRIFCGKDIKPDDWLWCKRCHRCYKAFEFRNLKVKGEIFLFCDCNDCNGDLPLDSRPWSKLIEGTSGLHRIPLKGKVYDPGLDSQHRE